MRIWKTIRITRLSEEQEFGLGGGLICKYASVPDGPHSRVIALQPASHSYRTGRVMFELIEIAALENGLFENQDWPLVYCHSSAYALQSSSHKD
jgi:hypothetical protein